MNDNLLKAFCLVIILMLFLFQSMIANSKSVPLDCKVPPAQIPLHCEK